MTRRLADRLAAELVTYDRHDWRHVPAAEPHQRCLRQGCAVIWWPGWDEPQAACRGREANR